MKYFISLVLVFFLTGCISTIVPAKIEYKINPRIQIIQVNNESCKLETLKVSNAFSSNYLMLQKMSYVLDNSKQYHYTKSKWSQTPNKAISYEFLSMLKQTELFKSVHSAKSRSRNEFILEIYIEDFMQYFNEDSTSSYAQVTLGLSLIHSRTNKVFSNERFTSRIKVDTLNSEGGVDGLNRALGNVLRQSNIWFNKVCK